MYKKVFGSFIILSLFALGLYSIFFSAQEEISYVENREFATTDEIHITEFFNGNFQNTIENVLTDQFYDRYVFVKQKNKVEYLFVNSFYNLLSNEMLLNPIGSGYVNQIGNSDILTTSPLIYNETNANRIYRRIDQINKFQEDHPELSVYVYKPTQLNESSFFDEANGFLGAGPEYGRIFEENLNVRYDKFVLSSFDEYPENFYTTDHHWNHQGSYTGYTQIANLLFENNVNILKPIDTNCKENVRFFGTYSSQSGYVTPGSKFCVYKFDLPEYQMYNLNGEMEIKNTNVFFDKDVTDTMGYFYNEAYVTGDGYTKIVTEYTDKENILIIGDSYGGPILPLLAEHFHEITFIYPTNYKALVGENFNYDNYVTENKINKVLIMYTIENYFLSDQWGDRYLDFDVYRNQ